MSIPEDVVSLFPRESHKIIALEQRFGHTSSVEKLTHHDQQSATEFISVAAPSVPSDLLPPILSPPRSSTSPSPSSELPTQSPQQQQQSVSGSVTPHKNLSTEEEQGKKHQQSATEFIKPSVPSVPLPPSRFSPSAEPTSQSLQQQQSVGGVESPLKATEFISVALPSVPSPPTRSSTSSSTGKTLCVDSPVVPSPRPTESVNVSSTSIDSPPFPPTPSHEFIKSESMSVPNPSDTPSTVNDPTTTSSSTDAQRSFQQVHQHWESVLDEEELMSDVDPPPESVIEVHHPTNSLPLPSFPSSPDQPKTVSRRRFTAEEDSIIQEGFEKFNGEWDEVIKWGNLNRTSIQVTARFRRLQRKSDPGQARAVIGCGSKSADFSPSRAVATEDMSSPLTPLALGSSQVVCSGSGRKAITDYFQKNEDGSPASKRMKRMGDDCSNQQFAELENQLFLQSKKYSDALLQLEQENSEREELYQSNEKKMNETISQLQSRNAILTKNITELLIQKSIAEKRFVREKVLQDSMRLGHPTFERQGMNFIEIWKDGYVFSDLRARLEAIASEKETIEGEVKSLKKKISAGKAADNTEIVEVCQEQHEILRIRLTSLKKEENDIADRFAVLQKEKNVHMREAKRVADEDSSSFNSFPLLRSNRYLLLRLLGKGGFSEVYEAFDIQECMYVACKIHSLNPLWSEQKKANYTKHACREYNIHKILVHPRVVRLYDVFEIDENSFCTVLEHCEGGDLDQYLKVHKVLSEKEAKSIMWQILDALAYLNSQKRPIIHYDLKPGNVLFTKKGEAKITDFGLSKVMEEGSDVVDLTSQGAGTYWYLPPECFVTGQAVISSKVDVWSAGVIMFQMVYGKKPFGNNMSQRKIMEQGVIANAQLQFPAKPVLSIEAKEFMRKCLDPSQSRRPDAETCKKDPFFVKRDHVSAKMPPPSKVVRPKKAEDSKQ